MPDVYKPTDATLRHILGNQNATTGRKTMDAIISELLRHREAVPEWTELQAAAVAVRDTAKRSKPGAFGLPLVEIDLVALGRLTTALEALEEEIVEYSCGVCGDLLARGDEVISPFCSCAGKAFGGLS